MSPSSQPSREEGPDWLAEAVRARRPLVWTGRGTSFALAQAFSEVTAQLGCPSRALPVDQCKGEAVCVVSQSACDPGLQTELLVTGVEEKPTWTAAPRIIVPGVLEEPRPWLPLPFMRGALAAVRASLGFPPSRMTSPNIVHGKRGAIVVTRMAGPLRTLNETAQCMIKELKLSVVSCDEFGHGIHARFFEKPRGPMFLGLSWSGDDPSRWTSIRRWLSMEAHVSHTTLDLTSTPSELPLDLMDLGLTIIEDLCTLNRIDWRTNRVPLSADWLRAPPPRQGEGPSGVRKE